MLRVQAESGFTLIELGVVLVLLGLILGIAVPSVRHSTQSSRLGVAADGIIAQVYLAREKAVDTQSDLVLRFAEDSLGSDFHIRTSDGGVTGKWSLPPQITYAPTSAMGMTLTREGRAYPAVQIILRDMGSHRDTVSILTSGMVVHP